MSIKAETCYWILVGEFVSSGTFHVLNLLFRGQIVIGVSDFGGFWFDLYRLSNYLWHLHLLVYRDWLDIVGLLTL